MKKLVVILLVMMFSLSTAYADTVTIDLSTATVDELTEVRDAVDARLSEIRLANAPALDDSFIISGNGTQILDGFDLTAPLSKFVGICDQEIKVTPYIGDESRTYQGYYSFYQSFADYWEEPVSITALMVETQGNWTLDFSPIGVIDTPYISGKGSFISDIFSASPPCIVTISFEHEYLSWETFEVRLNKIYSDGSIRWETMVDKRQGDDTTSFDVIIKPESDVVSYFWEFQCPYDIDWSITAK